jgi:thiamine biosynthesis lipoprotein
MDADAWATAIMVLGQAEGKTLAQKHGLDALLIQRRDGKLVQIPVGPVFQVPWADLGQVAQKERTPAFGKDRKIAAAIVS